MPITVIDPDGNEHEYPGPLTDFAQATFTEQGYTIEHPFGNVQEYPADPVKAQRIRDIEKRIEQHPSGSEEPIIPTLIEASRIFIEEGTQGKDEERPFGTAQV